ncbi:MAG: VOC family protein [Shimia sp.]
MIRSTLFAFLLAAGSTAAAEEMRFNNVAISVADIERSAAWYADVFGFEIVSRTYFEPVSAEVAFLARDDVRLELLDVGAPERIDALYVAPPDHLKTMGLKALVFDVTDLDAFNARLREVGVEIVWESLVLNDEGAVSTLLRDPDGNLINVFGVDE